MRLKTSRNEYNAKISCKDRCWSESGKLVIEILEG